VRDFLRAALASLAEEFHLLGIETEFNPPHTKGSNSRRS